jgi:hypothetical protein
MAIHFSGVGLNKIIFKIICPETELEKLIV